MPIMVVHMMEGRSELALSTFKRMEAECPEEMIRMFAPNFDGLMPARLHALIRFGHWEEILEQAQYPEFQHASRATRPLGVSRYAGARANQQVVKSFFVGEGVKLVLTAVLLSLVLLLTNSNALWLLTGFILAVVAQWIAPILFLKST